MGADSFVVYYGIRLIVQNEAETSALERRTDPRQRAARDAGLKSYFGRLTDGEPHHLLIGTEIGVFGIENQTCIEMPMDRLLQAVEVTDRKLKEAGFLQKPALVFQLEAQY